MRGGRDSGIGAWMDANLAVQGYSLSAAESRTLRWGLRFATALCVALVVTGLALQSAVLILALVPIGALAGFSSRHPFDLIWNRALAPALDAPPLPPNPTRRRHSFKLGMVWLLAVGLLLAFGHATAALTMGLVLVAMCGFLTATNYCVPSTILASFERWHRRSAPAT